MAAQYLYRLYHAQLTQLELLETPIPHPTVPNAMINFRAGTEIFKTDFLVSFDESTVDLVLQANTLVQAVSCLLIKTEVQLVVIFQLSAQKDADSETPVMILHPWGDDVAAPMLSPGTDNYYIGLGAQAEYIPPNSQSLNYSTFSASFGDFYKTYDLRAGSEWEPVPDRFMALCEARAVATGRMALRMYRHAVAVEDYFITSGRTITMSTKGSLFLTRFPLYREQMNKLPYTHSGYAVTRTGRLKAQRIAQTTRIANCISDMAVQRRVLARQPFGASVVAKEWYVATGRLARFFYANDRVGYIECKKAYVGPANGIPPILYTFPDSGFRGLMAMIPYICDFINLVGIATGNHSLLCWPRAAPVSQQESNFRLLQNKLRGFDGVVSQYAVKGHTRQTEILQAMIDTINYIQQQEINYLSDKAALPAVTAFTTVAGGIALAQQYKAVETQWGNYWPQAVAELYGVFCLLCTWELTWDVYVNTKLNKPKPRNETYNSYRVKSYVHPKDEPKAQVMTTPPSMLGRIATDRPNFAPFRFWQAPLCNDSYNDLQEEEERRQRKEQSDDFYKLLRDNEEAQRIERYNKRAQEIEAARLQWVEDNVPNPERIYDYRNFTRLQWWIEKSQEPMTAEFLLRALDTPDQLDPFKGFGLFPSRKTAQRVKSGTPTNDGKEFLYPKPTQAAVIPWQPIVKWVVNQVLDEAIDRAWGELGNQLTELANRMSDEDEYYSPQQFWPPNPF
jgi:hypothetical protein